MRTAVVDPFARAIDVVHLHVIGSLRANGPGPRVFAEDMAAGDLIALVAISVGQTPVNIRADQICCSRPHLLLVVASATGETNAVECCNRPHLLLMVDNVKASAVLEDDWVFR